MRPVYMAVSLTDDSKFPEDSLQGKLLSEASCLHAVNLTCLSP
jgi:hypothetical protein